ncbi:hypothetical protein N325_09546, partial [Colius striatus]
RDAQSLWRETVSTTQMLEDVLEELLCVLTDWPLHRTSTSDGRSIDICPLAATRALLEIIRRPRCQDSLSVFFPQLFLALLFPIFFIAE